MASTTTPPPSVTQVLFARAVILTMGLWPAMRLAVSEEWGGVDSADKRDFLISHICDTYADETSAGSFSSSSTATPQAPATPDQDDLAETIEMYFEDEYESRIEDGSADWVAARLVQLHKRIYATFPPTEASLQEAQAEVDKLAQAAEQLRGQKVQVERSGEPGGEEEDSSSGSGSEEEGEAMHVDGEASGSNTAAQRSRPEPVVDEDGFTTVVKGRRR